MDGKPRYVIAAAPSIGISTCLRTVLTGVALGASLLLQSSAAAQFGWPASWNPWKQDVEAGQTPTDPFAARRSTPGPEYRVAAQPAPPQIRTSNYSANPTPYPPAASPYPQAASYPVTNSMGGSAAVVSDEHPYPQSNQPGPTYYLGTPARQTSTSRYPTADPAAAPQYAAPLTAPQSPPGGGYSYANYSASTPQQNFGPPRPAPAATSMAEDGDLFQPARIVAIVNGEPILAGDVLGPVNQILEERIASMPAEQQAEVTQEDRDKFREQALKQMLPGLIDIKVVYLDFMRSVPADRREEMEKALDKNYDEYQLETDLEAAGVNTPAELDLKLRETGGSLAKKKRMFVEKLVAQQQIQRNVKLDEEVTHLQMLDYYNQHAADYAKPARAKWEQLMVKFEQFPTRDAAWEAVANMGNQVLRGAPLDAVAQRQSQGIRAAKGGQYDWTSKGSLKNETIDQAIFSLPIGELSPILESAEGFHIVRVIQREEEGMVPFTKAQVEIKDKIKNERRQSQMEAYLKEVKSKAQVWTVFDNPA